MTRRLILSYLGITLFTLLILEIPLALFFATLEIRQLEAGFERDALILATLYEDALDSGRPYSPQPALDYAANTGARVVVVDRAGTSIVDSAREVNLDFSNRPEVAAALGGRTEVGRRPSETLGDDLLYAAVPVASGGVVHGAIRLTVDPDQVEARIRRYWWSLAAIGAVVLGAVALAAWILARSMTRPLKDVQAAARRAETGDLSVRIDSTGAPEEIAALGAAFNQMAERLDEHIRRQQAFVADASHELRTPLTALRLRLENMEPNVSPAGKPDHEAALVEAERLGDLVDQLLSIARTESAKQVVEPVGLGDAIRERLELWHAVAEGRAVSVTSRLPDGEPQVLALPGSLDQILDNLLSNAIAVSPRGGTIVVSVVPAGDFYEIHVVDEGPGLPPLDRARAFDRFWRADHTTPGSGLGLAIVGELVAVAGGSAVLEVAPTGGIDAVVRLRAAEDAMGREGPGGEPGSIASPGIGRR